MIGPDHFEPQKGAGENGEDMPAELTIEVLRWRGPHCQDPNEVTCASVLGVIRNVIGYRFNGAHLTTCLIPGGTDSYWYAKHPSKVPVCLGFTPIKLDPDMKFADLFHGTNERIPVEGYKWGIRVFMDVVYLVCGAKLNK